MTHIKNIEDRKKKEEIDKETDVIILLHYHPVSLNS